MTEFLKNQKYAFFTLIGSVLIIAIIWYFTLHKHVLSSYNENRAQYITIENNRDLYQKMKKRLPAVEAELDLLNSSFQETLNKIAIKENYDNAANALYELLMNNNFDVKVFSPSKIPLEKKIIKSINSDNMISVGKYPIDIHIYGDFVQLGELLDAVKLLPYRITINNIQIEDKSSNSVQNIKLIAYLYLQSGKKHIDPSKTNDVVFQQSQPINPIHSSKNVSGSVEKPFKNMKLGNANYRAKMQGLKNFWWTNSSGIYTEDETRTNGLGDYIEPNTTGKVTVY